MDDDYYGYRVGDFKPGQRVELHPATDLWMSGVRFGDVTSTGRVKVHVQFDRLKGTRLVDPRLIRPVLL